MILCSFIANRFPGLPLWGGLLYQTSANIYQTSCGFTKRKRPTFANLTRRKRRRERSPTRSKGEFNDDALDREARASYHRAIELLKPSGIALELAVAQFVEASRVCGREDADHQPGCLNHDPDCLRHTCKTAGYNSKRISEGRGGDFVRPSSFRDGNGWKIFYAKALSNFFCLKRRRSDAD